MDVGLSPVSSMVPAWQGVMRLRRGASLSLGRCLVRALQSITGTLVNFGEIYADTLSDVRASSSGVVNANVGLLHAIK